MAITKTKSKMTATRAFINTWLKDKRLFCATCGRTYNGSICCEEPYVVDNFKRASDFIAANKEAKEQMENEFGSTKSRQMRFAIRMPAELMRALQKYFAENYGEQFLVDVAEGRRFMKEFPQFCACERI